MNFLNYRALRAHGYPKYLLTVVYQKHPDDLTPHQLNNMDEIIGLIEEEFGDTEKEIFYDYFKHQMIQKELCEKYNLTISEIRLILKEMSDYVSSKLSVREELYSSMRQRKKHFEIVDPLKLTLEDLRLNPNLIKELQKHKVFTVEDLLTKNIRRYREIDQYRMKEIKWKLYQFAGISYTDDLIRLEKNKKNIKKHPCWF